MLNKIEASLVLPHSSPKTVQRTFHFLQACHHGVFVSVFKIMSGCVECLSAVRKCHTEVHNSFMTFLREFSDYKEHVYRCFRNPQRLPRICPFWSRRTLSRFNRTFASICAAIDSKDNTQQHSCNNPHKILKNYKSETALDRTDSCRGGRLN